MDVQDKIDRMKEVIWRGPKTIFKPIPDISEDPSYWLNLDIESLTRAELRNHLAARDRPVDGSKNTLKERLAELLQEIHSHIEASDIAREAEFRRIAAQESRGSVYAIGCNAQGQLGLGDTEPRDMFTVNPSLRGVSVMGLTAGVDFVFAITDDTDVYAWGGAGGAPMGMQFSLDDARDGFYRHPVYIQTLKGEEIVSISAGASHGLAVSRGGDCFCWGLGSSGQLGIGNFEHRHNVTTLPLAQQRMNPPETKETLAKTAVPGEGEQKKPYYISISQVGAGQSHSVALTAQGKVYTWGHGADGRLGIGATERFGLLDNAKSKLFPSPAILSVGPMANLFVKQIACGSAHSIAVCKGGSTFTWGSGSGGRLGLGDTKDRYIPTRVPHLDGKAVLQVSCGTWHTAAVICVPPLCNCGWVYTWGSGYDGQLGQGSTKVSLVPAIVATFVELRLPVKEVVCGSHHNAAITADGEMYTWGSNKFGCLGREIREEELAVLENAGDKRLYHDENDRAVTGGPEEVIRPSSPTNKENAEEEVGEEEGKRGILPPLSPASSRSEKAGKRRFMTSGGAMTAIAKAPKDKTEDMSELKEPLNAHEDIRLPLNFTPFPGHVGGFGKLVDRIGRGLVRRVACGRNFTVVSTFTYEGPTEEVAKALMEEDKVQRDLAAVQEKQRKEKEEAEMQENLRAARRKNAVQDKQGWKKYYCSRCPGCEGFTPKVLKIFQCVCEHSRDVHTLTKAQHDAKKLEKENEEEEGGQEN